MNAIRRTSRLGRAALVLGGVVVGWTLAEIGLGLLPATGPRSGRMVPRGVRTPLRPGTVTFQPHYAGELVGPEFRVPVTMNALGFRERELDLATLATRRPILFLGDSYFFGWGVRREERLTEVLSAARLDDPDAAPIVNLSFPGYGTRNYLHVLEAWGDSLNPRLVVVGFFVGNDFLDDFNMAEPPAGDDAPGGFRSRLHEWKRDARAAIRKSRVVSVVHAGLGRIRGIRRLLRRLDLGSDRMVCWEKEAGPLQERLFGTTRHALEGLADWSAARGVPLAVVVIPDHLQVLEPEIFRELDARKPQRVLAGILAARGVAAIDLLDPLLATETPQSLYFARDKHWNAAGHAFVAELLAERLEGLRTGAATSPE